MSFLFFLLKDRSLRRVPLGAQTLNEITEKITSKKSLFLSDDISVVTFNGQYKPDDDEVLCADVTLDEMFAKIPDNTFEIDVINLPDDDVVALGLYDEGIYYFQCIFNQIVMKNNRYAVILSHDTYVKMDNKTMFTIDDNIHAIYKDGKLYFQSYLLANKIFSLAELFDGANNTKIDTIFTGDIFAGTDTEWLKNNADSKMRKQITQIEQSGVLNVIKPTNKTFKSLAKKAGINSSVYETGHIVLPQNKKECKKVLAFLNQDLFNGIFTKELFQSNSKRKL